MNIQEAIQSGKKFKRPHWTFWLHIVDFKIVDELGTWQFRSIYSDIMADDWIIEEEAVLVTRSHVQDALDGMLHSCSRWSRLDFLKALGFKE